MSSEFAKICRIVALAQLFFDLGIDCIVGDMCDADGWDGCFWLGATGAGLATKTEVQVEIEHRHFRKCSVQFLSGSSSKLPLQWIPNS